MLLSSFVFANAGASLAAFTDGKSSRTQYALSLVIFTSVSSGTARKLAGAYVLCIQRIFLHVALRRSVGREHDLLLIFLLRFLRVDLVVQHFDAYSLTMQLYRLDWNVHF